MDKTALKIAFAALIHDIGKFADNENLDLPNSFIQDNAEKYLPSSNNKYFHHHAIYSKAFIEQAKDLFPKELGNISSGDEDSLIGLVASHHNPKTPHQWIIAVADRISNGWKLDEFEEQYNNKPNKDDYKKTRLLTIFEQMSLDKDKREQYEKEEDFSYRYPLKKLSPKDKNIFPGNREDIEPKKSEQAKEDYKNLFKDFMGDLKNLFHRDENHKLWFEHFDSLMLVYTSSIPAAQIENVLPDVSLYDHSKVTAALATALYLYHDNEKTLTPDAIKDYKVPKFLLVSGDFYGIQDFILSEHGDIQKFRTGDTRKYRAKLLRGRSFMISLFTELAADMLCRKIGVPSSSVVLNAAGKFTVVLPNTDETKKQVEEVEEEINDWLIDKFYGENSLGLSYIEATADDLISDNFSAVWDKMSLALGRKKFSRIDLEKHAGTIEGYLKSFTDDDHVCSFCGKRPSQPEARKSDYVDRTDDGYTCKVCRDHVFLGTNLVKKDRLAVLTKNSDLNEKENRLFVPIFDEYQIAFLDEELNKMAKDGKLLKYWDLTYERERKKESDDKKPPFISLKFINGYIPQLKEGDINDKRIQQVTKRGEETELKKSIEGNYPKQFDHIAAMARKEEKGEDGGSTFIGTYALGILKADVDNLGLLMACGLKDEKYNMSRLVTLSRQLHYFFAVYLPYFLESESNFSDIYTVFAGGDDLFLIGPWNRIIDLASCLKDEFASYVCNEEIHFSAGITLHKPHTPLDYLAKASEDALNDSKKPRTPPTNSEKVPEDALDDFKREEEKNQLTLFSKTIKWDELDNLNQIKDELAEWLYEEKINNAMVFRLNDLVQMAEEEKRVVVNDEIHIDDMECTKWRSRLVYTAVRNIGREIKDKDEREAAVKAILDNTTMWIESYGGNFIIPLWYIIYNNRREVFHETDQFVER